MYEDFPPAEKPADDATIWRYMDFTKFVSMLDTQSLYFARVHDLALADPFEGAYTNVAEFVDVSISWASEEERKKVKDNLNRVMRRGAKTLRYYLYANCWHLNEHESAAMWSLYLKSGEGVAIRSTFGRLRASIEAAPQIVRAGKVTYLDYNKDRMESGNALMPILHKRISYAHEQELRAFYWVLPDMSPDALQGKENQEPETPPGVPITTALNRLIDRVHVAPTCPGWFRDLVASVVKKYGYGFEVRKSHLADGPIW